MVTDINDHPRNIPVKFVFKWNGGLVSEKKVKVLKVNG